MIAVVLGGSPSGQNMDTSDYARVLMPAIPRRAFAPNPRKLIVCGMHLAVVVVGWVAFRFVAYFYWPLISLVIGASLSCVALIAHDVSHRNVVRGKFVLYPTELVLLVPSVHAGYGVEAGPHLPSCRDQLRGRSGAPISDL